MRGALKEAYEWAHKSYDLFKRNNGDNDKSTKLLELYVQAWPNEFVPIRN